MGHHLGSNCIRSLPAKGRIAGYTELARISQRVMRISSTDACRFRRTGGYGISTTRVDQAYSDLMLAARITLAHFSISSAMSLPQSLGEPARRSLPMAANAAWRLRSVRRGL